MEESAPLSRGPASEARGAGHGRDVRSGMADLGAPAR